MGQAAVASVGRGVEKGLDAEARRVSSCGISTSATV